eukprot:5531854-Prymnesium_polylepis.1
MAHGTASTSVEVMDDYVRVCTLDRSQIPIVFHSLLRITLFTDRERFLSVTVSSSDVTLVAAPEDLAHFDGLGLQQDGTDWRVVRVGEGAEGFEKVGVIERITGPLAAASIPVTPPGLKPSTARYVAAEPQVRSPMAGAVRKHLLERLRADPERPARRGARPVWPCGRARRRARALLVGARSGAGGAGGIGRGDPPLAPGLRAAGAHAHPAD